MSPPDDPTTTGTITQKDIEAKFREIKGDIDETAESAQGIAITVGAVIAVVVVARCLRARQAARQEEVHVHRSAQALMASKSRTVTAPAVGPIIRILRRNGIRKGIFGGSRGLGRGRRGHLGLHDAQAVGPPRARARLQRGAEAGGADHHHEQRPDASATVRSNSSARSAGHNGGVKVLLRNPRREVEVAGPISIVACSTASASTATRCW